MAEYWTKLKSLLPNLNSGSRKRAADRAPPPPPFKDLGTVDQAPLDFKRYKVIQLRNGMKICLVSTCKHKTTDPPPTSLSYSPPPPASESLHPSKVPKLDSCCKDSPSSLCVYVGAGHFHDPPKTQGMAHLVEHLIFLGSKQYPEPHKLLLSGGIVNATTFSENTNFYFACNELSSLEDYVDMLVDGLTNPLFSKPAMLQEIEMVDSEYSLYQSHDFTRIIDFIKSLARKSHPFSKFKCGNKKTLNKPDILRQVREWKERYYCADNMTACIQAPMSMKKLESLAVKYFSDIPSSTASKSPTQELLDHGEPFAKEDFEAAYYILPLNLLTVLTVSWALPSKFWKSYEEKPLEYIRMLLECTSKGGLKHYLRKKNWIYSWSHVFVVVNCDDQRNTFCTMFSLCIQLSDKGYEDKIDVLQAVFSYLKMLRKDGVRLELFREMFKISANKWHYTNWEEVLERGKDIAESMQNVEKVADILTSITLMSSYDPKLIKEALDGLKPRSANYIFVSRKNLGLCKDKALPNKMQYAKENISKKWYTLWEDTEIFSDFILPTHSCFTPREIRLIPSSNGLPLKQTGTVHEDAKLKVVRTSDKTSPCLSPRVPNCSIDISLRSPAVTGSSLRLKMAVLQYWCRLLVERITELTGHQFDHLFICNIEFTWEEKGVDIYVEGPSGHVFELVELVVKEVFGNCGLDEEGGLEAAENIRMEYIRGCVNYTYDPRLLSRDMLLYLQHEGYPSLFEMKEGVSDMSLAGGDLIRLLEQFRKRLLVDVVINGSMTTGDAHTIVSLLTTKVNYSAPRIMPANSNRMNLLPVGTSLLPIAARHPAYMFSVVTNFYQVNAWEDKNKGQARKFVYMAYLELNWRIFEQLRTKEHLGYAVQLNIHFEPLGISATVMTQPEKFQTYQIDNRIDNFMRDFYNKYLGPNPVEKLFRSGELVPFRSFYEANLLKEGKNFRKLSLQLQGYLPGTRITTKMQKQLTAQGDSGDEDKSLIELEYLDLVKEEKKKLSRDKIRLIGSLGQFKKEMELLPVRL